MRRRRCKSKHAEARPRNFANHGSRTDGWAPQEGVGQGVKPRRMLLCAFGGDGGAMELFLVSMQAGVKGEAIRQHLLWAGMRCDGNY